MKEADFLEPLPGIKPLFIVGCDRSGTSMLLKLVNQYSSIAIPSESHFLIDYMKRYDHYETLQDDHTLERLLRDILDEPFVKEFDAKYNIQRLIKRVIPRTYAGAVKAIYETFQEQHNKSRWGDKTPVYVLYIDEILRIFPDAQFVHVIRDGRDCALSLLERPWGPKNIYKAACWWTKLVSEGIEKGRKLSEKQYIEVKYEKVLTSPEEEVGRLFSFIDDPLSQETLKGFDFKKNNFFKWKMKMPAKQQKIFEKVAGGLLDKLGYERIYDSLRSMKPLEKAYYTIENRIRSSANILFDIKRTWKLKFRTPRNVE